MAGGAQASAVPGGHGVFEADEDAALAELQRAWADGGYHGFCVLEHSLRSAVRSSGEVLTGNTPDPLDQQIGEPAGMPGTPPLRARHRSAAGQVPVGQSMTSAVSAAGAAASASDRRPD